MNKRVWVIAALALILLISAFLFLDFHAVRSTTKNDTVVNTYSLGIEQGQRPPAIPALRVFIEGKGAFTNALQRELIRYLERHGSYGQVKVLDEPEGFADEPLMHVSVRRQVTIWTPIFAQASYQVTLVYASDGDLTWREDESVVIELKQIPSIRLRGVFGVQDRSLGLVTWHGYESYLGRRTADILTQTLEQHLYPD